MKHRFESKTFFHVFQKKVGNSFSDNFIKSCYEMFANKRGWESVKKVKVLRKRVVYDVVDIDEEEAAYMTKILKKYDKISKSSYINYENGKTEIFYEYNYMTTIELNSDNMGRGLRTFCKENSYVYARTNHSSRSITVFSNDKNDLIKIKLKFSDVDIIDLTDIHELYKKYNELSLIS